MTEPTSRFAVNLDYDTDATFKRVTDRIGEHTGRLRSYRGQRHPSRADVLRAMLTVVAQNPHVERAVLEQVRADALSYVEHDGRRGPAAELLAIADELARLGPLMDTGESQDWITNHVAPGVRELASSAEARPIETAAFIVGHAGSVARTGAAHGGYTYGRPMQDLARRLEQVRDALDPREKATCPRCSQLVRTIGRPGSTVPDLERHTDQAGSTCGA